MPSHDDWILEGHDAGWDGEGCCPSCTARFADCECCPICEGDGRIRSAGQFLLCPACDGEGLLKRPPVAAAGDKETPL